jgi:predicted 2-oxoglutarate/Fe(II)-dependent dioxygenase YbiX
MIRGARRRLGERTMASVKLLSRLGLFVASDFLGADACAGLRSEMRSAALAPATVWGGETDLRLVDESIRSARRAEVSATARGLVGERLGALRPALEAHFGVPLNALRPLQFLVYRKGDYYRPHKDASQDDPPGTKRRVTAVIFLNGQAGEPGLEEYGGGSLNFYGLIDDPRGRALGFPLAGEAGLLVAFRSETVHEVAPVTHGDRYTVVCWFV